MPGLYRRTLFCAQQVLGGPVALARYLRAQPATLAAWLSGQEEVPDAVFLRIVDLLLDDMDALQRHAAAAARHLGQVDRVLDLKKD